LAKVKVTQSLQPSSDQQWPKKTDVFFRPERLKYVRNKVKKKGCVFCDAAKERVSFESLCLYRDRHSMVVMNKYPYNTGHLLILPVRHEGRFTKLSPRELESIQGILQKSLAILEKEYAPAGLNVGLNLGAAAGAGIPKHLHYHVIPRWWGDTNFFPLVAETKVVVESLEQTYERLLPYFKRLARKGR